MDVLGGLSEEASTSEPQARPIDSLEEVDFQMWTKVPIENIEAARILTKYFQVDHNILGLFDAGLFLEDLRTNNQLYCSKFMVNALLSWASVSPSMFFPANIPFSGRIEEVLTLE